MRPSVQFRWIKNRTYQDVWDIQTSLHKQLIDKKLAKRNMPSSNKNVKDQSNQLIFCEHAHVFTLGKSGSIDHLLLSKDELNYGNIEFFNINRGGDITYHGPGQITGYPIFDLDEFFNDVHKYVRLIEEVMIRILATYGLKGVRINNYTGVWLEPNNSSPKYRKICAIGVHLSRWVSMHGFAFNVNTDLAYFDKIIPCGIADENKAVTSLETELGKSVSIDEVGERMVTIFSELFEFELVK
ncbi:MAG: lipoyl(octanoyl) transferase LipB [Saprospiraceae bacterium]|nr:lipoyl(octanoyl) transferase LipB [Saprospiraceae bacterium]